MDPDRHPADALVKRSLLHRPRIGRQVHRSRLIEELDRGLDSRLTMVSAPAGFGKTLLIGEWCRGLDQPVAWLCLDPTLNDPAVFLAHLAAAVRIAVPGSLVHTSDMAAAPLLATEEALVRELSEELNSLPRDLVIVLDDYHVVTEPAVRRLVSAVVDRCRPRVHLVVLARIAPPLAISALSNDGAACEVGADDLAFTAGEVAELAEIELGGRADLAEVRALAESSEGWPVGVRLAVEAARHGDRSAARSRWLHQSSRDYLVAEVLDQLPTSVRRHLFAVTQLDKFSARLCGALAAADPAETGDMSGDEFISWMQSRNLFLIPLDDDGVWFRLHSVFAQTLRACAADPQWGLRRDDRDVHRVACRVFEDEGMLDDAIDAAVRAGLESDTARLAADRGALLADDGNLADLSRLMARVPVRVVESSAALLVLDAWASMFGTADFRREDELARAEVLLGSADERDRTGDPVIAGMLALLRSHGSFISGQMKPAADGATEAVRLLGATAGRRLVIAVVQLVASLTAMGRFDDAADAARSSTVLPNPDDRGWDPSALALAALSWRSCDVALLERSGARLLDLGTRFGHDADVLDARYCLGIAAYERNRLAEADDHLQHLVERRFAAPAMLVAHALAALSLSRLAGGDDAGADAAAQNLGSYVSDTRSERLQPLVGALLAEMSLRRGETQAALRWARRVELDPANMQFFFFNPVAVQVRVLLAAPADAERGRGLLAAALDAAERQHHRPMIIRLLGLRSIDHRDRGEHEAALQAAGRAVGMATTGGAVRLLADLGPGLAPVLRDLDDAGLGTPHIATILTAMGAGASAPAPRPRSGLEPEHLIDLTDRERDVLRLLADRRSNKEIAAALSIAPATVKKHTVRLYEKLQVDGRHEAAAAAKAFGYVID